MKNSALVLIILATLLSEGVGKHVVRVYDYQGRYMGTAETLRGTKRPEIRAMMPTERVTRNGGSLHLPAGLYWFIPSLAGPDTSSHVLGNQFGFKDVTGDYFPLDEWDGGDIEVGDLNGDGRTDVAFSQWGDCDSSLDYRPRVWIQGSQGSFIDETLARIPDVSVPCRDIELFDADSDGDVDIFLTGYSCSQTLHVSAALFVNDGSGFFSDESSERLPQVGMFAFFAEAATVDSNVSIDLIVNVFGGGGETTLQVVKPEIWLNDGYGFFVRDTLGRLPDGGSYGFLELIAGDIDSDDRTDIIFANTSMIITDEEGNVIDSLTGGNACYHNTGDGFFQDETQSRMPEPDNPDTRDLAISDIDKDGDLDILEVGFPFGHYAHQVRLLANDGEGIFSVSENSLTDSLFGWFNDSEFEMLNDDEFPDLFMTKVLAGLPNYDVLLVNNGDGTFSDASDRLPLNLDFSVSCELFDHEDDGDIDVVIANSGPLAGLVGQNALYDNTLYEITTSIAFQVHNPEYFSLFQNYPNPFNPTTTIEFSMPQSGWATLTVYDLLGREVTVLVDSWQEAGRHSVEWNATNVPSGIHFVRMQAGDFGQTKKIVLLK